MQPHGGGEDVIVFGMFGLMALFFLGGCMLSLGSLALLIWAVVDCAQREFPGENEKLMWILVIVLVGLIGPIIYLIVGRPKGTKPPPSIEAASLEP